MDEFIKFLKDWINEINDLNSVQNASNFILLDKDYFNFCKKTNKYTINEDSINKWKNSKILFIGDNPGTRERENFSYFYYDPNHTNGNDYKTAGYKYYCFINNLGLVKEQIVKFNKCLISTASTSKLSQSQIELTKHLVCSFIVNFSKYFPNSFIIFSGISGIKNWNSKFKKIYKDLDKIIRNDNTGFMGHISRGKFPKSSNFKEGDYTNLKSVSKEYKIMLFSGIVLDNNKIDCTKCAFKSFCFPCDDGDTSTCIQ